MEHVAGQRTGRLLTSCNEEQPDSFFTRKCVQPDRLASRQTVTRACNSRGEASTAFRTNCGQQTQTRNGVRRRVRGVSSHGSYRLSRWCHVERHPWHLFRSLSIWRRPLAPPRRWPLRADSPHQRPRGIRGGPMDVEERRVARSAVALRLPGRDQRLWTTKQ